MNNNEIKKTILNELAEAHEPDDIIFEVCEKYGLSWKNAEALVRQVHEDDWDSITLRQAPLLTALAIAIFIPGLALLAYGMYQILGVGSALLRIENLKNTPLLDRFYLPGILMIQISLDPFTAILIGMVLIFGSVIGMRDVWAAILSKLKIGP